MCFQSRIRFPSLFAYSKLAIAQFQQVMVQSKSVQNPFGSCSRVCVWFRPGAERRHQVFDAGGLSRSLLLFLPLPDVHVQALGPQRRVDPLLVLRLLDPFLVATRSL